MAHLARPLWQYPDVSSPETVCLFHFSIGSAAGRLAFHAPDRLVAIYHNITPARFFGIEVGRAYDVAIPLCAEQRLGAANSQLTVHKNNYWMSAIGRLRDGWTVEQADAHLRAIAAQVFMASLPDGAPADKAERYKAMWLHTVAAGKGMSWLRVDYQQSLWLLLLWALFTVWRAVSQVCRRGPPAVLSVASGLRGGLLGILVMNVAETALSSERLAFMLPMLLAATIAWGRDVASVPGPAA